uniref:Uncharacterized protein n=1 Tax=Leersia perrieri TaxID=77586 RepID=A0A0D9WPX9_9ORYZ
MDSTEDNHSRFSQSLWRLSLFYPNLERVILNVQSRTIVDPVHKNQHAMAAHFRIHIHSDGMAKGTVRHIKYNPDHSFSLIKPQASQMGIIGVSDLLQNCLSLGYIPQPVSAIVGSTFVPAATPAVDRTLSLGPGPTTP